MIDRTLYEPVFIISQDSTDTCIIRNVDDDYYARNKDILCATPKKENMLDSLQSLLHGFINRSNEGSLSLQKPLYALTEERNTELN